MFKVVQMLIRSKSHLKFLIINIPNLSSSNNSSKSESESSFCNEEKSSIANIFDKQFLDPLIKELQVSKLKTKLLVRNLNMRNLVTNDVKVKHTTERDKPFQKYFDFKYPHAVFNDIDSLIKTSYNIEHRPSDCILFIDGSVLSLKAVLLHNENVLAPIPLYYGKNRP